MFDKDVIRLVFCPELVTLDTYFYAMYSTYKRVRGKSSGGNCSTRRLTTHYEW